MRYKQFSKVEFQAAYRAMRLNRANEEREGFRLHYPDCYYDPAGQAASLCLYCRSLPEPLIAQELNTQLGASFAKGQRAFWGGSHA